MPPSPRRLPNSLRTPLRAGLAPEHLAARGRARPRRAVLQARVAVTRTTCRTLHVSLMIKRRPLAEAARHSLVRFPHHVCLGHWPKNGGKKGHLRARADLRAHARDFWHRISFGSTPGRLDDEIVRCGTRRAWP
jgi:hypothetical protein